MIMGREGGVRSTVLVAADDARKEGFLRGIGLRSRSDH